MDIKNLLLTEIEKVSDNEFKYKLIDLDLLNPFEIYDKWILSDNLTEPRATQFLKDICVDNGKPFTDSIVLFNKKCPLYFQGVYLNNNPLIADDIVIIPNSEARGLYKINENLFELCRCVNNLKGEI